jgi:glutathione S-transferase
MRLIGSKTSPYVRKVRVLLAEKHIAHDFAEDNVWDEKTQVTAVNPLTKVPVLVLSDGTPLYDSSVITDYLDTLGDPHFIPADPVARALARRDEALGNGIADAGILIFLERKRVSERQDPAWMARQRGKIDAGIGAIATQLGDQKFLRGEQPTLGDIACACALFWVEFRLPEVNWRSGNPGLAAWAERIGARPSFSATRPQA